MGDVVTEATSPKVIPTFYVPPDEEDEEDVEKKGKGGKRKTR